jgi:probable selenium-dependent hydroxylase accessory protein YqeC
MEIYSVSLSGKPKLEESLLQAFQLDINQRQTIAFVGAGGKTSTMFQLAEELVSLGKNVILTTTTHMFLPDQYGVQEEDKEKLLNMLHTYHMAVVGIPCDNGKMAGVSDSFYQWMTTATDFILVEADGSKRLPLKAPNSTEPVLPDNTDIIVVVAGLSCLNKPIAEICHRPELAAKVLNCNLTHKVEPKDVAELIINGYCKNLSKPCKILLNQRDCVKEWKDIISITKYLDGYDCVIKGRGSL